MQWHPEKSKFEYLSGELDIPNQGINHSENSVKVSVEMASVFVRTARRNRHLYTGEYPWVWDFELNPGTIFEQLFLIDTFEWNRKYGNHRKEELRQWSNHTMPMIYPLFGST